jgi:hypothetical protein
MNCIITCLTETWLSDLCYNHSLFPDVYIVFCSERASINETRGGGVFIAIFSRVRSYKGRYDLEFSDECVWVEIHTFNGISIFLVSWGGVRLSPLGTLATNWPIVPVPDDR